MGYFILLCSSKEASLKVFAPHPKKELIFSENEKEQFIPLKTKGSNAIFDKKAQNDLVHKLS